MEPVLLVVIVLLAVAVVVLVASRQGRRGGVGGPGGVRPPAVDERRVAASNDPMAEVVASHSQAVEPQDAAAEELRLRAQANRVAAAKHQRQGDALAPDSSEAAQLQAQSHEDAAAQHQRTADELDRRS